MGNSKFDISVVIVNYKVKEYISNLLSSLEKAKGELSLQIIVVDNNSGDDSISYLSKRYPEVTYIENQENLGFGKANNQALDIADGEYTLIINPDTLVSEDTLQVLVAHMIENDRCGACGCKILNPDGSFAPESKRSVPTLRTAISKVLGLNSIFPKSKLFGSYYLGWIDPDEPAQIPVLSGSFMFWRTNVLKTLGGFDERFFMYGEDIDLCYRIQDTGYHIDYVPATSIIHYKGESTRKGDLKYVRIFNKALFQFFDKHHSKNYSQLFKGLVFIAIWVRIFLSFILNNLRAVGALTTDLLLLNVSVITGFLIRFNFSVEIFTNIQSLKYLWINVLASVFYVSIGSLFDLFKNKQASISSAFKAVISTYVGIAVLTFFVRNLAFSRLALIYGLAIALLIFLIHRLVHINLSKTGEKITGKLKTSKILLVGDEEDAIPIRDQIHARADWNYQIMGVVSTGNREGDYIGELPQLKDLIRAYNIDQVFFLLQSVTYKTMLDHISKLQDERVILKLIPDSMDFILGKSNVEYLEQIPLVDIAFSFNKGLNRWIKRVSELVIVLPICTLLSPLILIANWKLKHSSIEKKPLRFIQPILANKWLNTALLCWYVLTGRLHLVGGTLSNSSNPQYGLKPGIVGYAQINSQRLSSKEDLANYELYYLQNYSIWMDIDILLKSFLSDYSAIKSLAAELD